MSEQVKELKQSVDDLKQVAAEQEVQIIQLTQAIEAIGRTNEVYQYLKRGYIMTRVGSIEANAFERNMTALYNTRGGR